MFDRLPVKFQHPKDVAQNRAAAQQRANERGWADRVCEPNRVYDALVKDAGYDHNYHAPVKPSIIYDSIAGRWVEATTVTQLSNSSSSNSRVVTRDSKRVMKSYVSKTDW